MELELLTVVIVLAAVVTGVTATASTITAGQQTETVLEGVLDGPDANEATSRWALDGAKTGWSWFRGTADRRLAQLADVPSAALDALGAGDGGPTAGSKARAVTSTWNANADSLESYAADRDRWTTNHTVEITWHLNGGSATRYLLANASNGSLSTRMVANTSRTPDETVALCGYAAAQSPGELQTFVETYASPNESVGSAYKARLKGKYGPLVETTLYPSSGECPGSIQPTEEVASRAW